MIEIYARTAMSSPALIRNRSYTPHEGAMVLTIEDHEIRRELTPLGWMWIAEQSTLTHLLTKNGWYDASGLP